MDGVQRLNLDPLQGPFPQGLNPKFLGMLGVGIKVLVTAPKSPRRPQGVPAVGFITGAHKTLGIHERFDPHDAILLAFYQS